MNFKWTDDPKVEDLFLKWGVEAKIKTVGFAHIRLTKDNPGRPEFRLDQLKVNEYGVAMINGDVFPRPVLREIGKDHYEVWGGNHRIYGAKEAGATQVEAYIIKSDDTFIIEILPLRANQLNGVSLTRDQLLIAAAKLVNEHGRTIRDAAKFFNLEERGLNDHMLAEKVDKRLIAAGLDTLKVSKGVLVKMNKLAMNDMILTKTGELIVKYSSTAAEASELIDGVLKSFRSGENQALRFIGEQEESLSKRAKLTGRKSPHGRMAQADRFRRMLSGLVNFIGDSTKPEQLQLSSPEQKQLLADLAIPLAHKLGKIFGFKIYTKEELHGAAKNGTVASGRKPVSK